VSAACACTGPPQLDQNIPYNPVPTLGIPRVPSLCFQRPEQKRFKPLICASGRPVLRPCTNSVNATSVFSAEEAGLHPFEAIVLMAACIHSTFTDATWRLLTSV
jgi:hypothetical protein